MTHPHCHRLSPYYPSFLDRGYRDVLVVGVLEDLVVAATSAVTGHLGRSVSSNLAVMRGFTPTGGTRGSNRGSTVRGVSRVPTWAGGGGVPKEERVWAGPAKASPLGSVMPPRLSVVLRVIGLLCPLVRSVSSMSPSSARCQQGAHSGGG